MNDSDQQGDKPTLYERLGGVYAIAAVVDDFSERLFTNPKIVNANPDLQQWHTETFKQRLPGLKFMRTLWMCQETGGPFTYSGKSMKDAHFQLHISPEVFDEVAKELVATLDKFNVPKPEQQEILNAFAVRKPDVTAGSNPQG